MGYYLCSAVNIKSSFEIRIRANFKWDKNLCLAFTLPQQMPDATNKQKNNLKTNSSCYETWVESFTKSCLSFRLSNKISIQSYVSHLRQFDIGPYGESILSKILKESVCHHSIGDQLCTPSRRFIPLLVWILLHTDPSTVNI